MENDENDVAQTAVSEGEAAGQPVAGDELAAVREVVLRAHPDTVSELVRGESVAELLASVEPARAAYQRLAEHMRQRAAAPTSPVVPAGTTPPVAIDPDRLPATEKIRRGLAVKR